MFSKRVRLGKTRNRKSGNRRSSYALSAMAGVKSPSASLTRAGQALTRGPPKPRVIPSLRHGRGNDVATA